METLTNKDDADSIKKMVQGNYANVAKSGLSNDSSAVRDVAAAFGYSEAELAAVPTEANMGLSCGNPVALASLKPGEVVVDLGCGGGLDVFLAAGKVGPTGKAIGIDMTPAMLERARAGAAKKGVTNVEFHQASIDALPLPDASVDCIISNCVVNLVPDKDKVFRECLRVLKPGGRIALSDIALKQPLPDQIKNDIQAYVGCIAGAILIQDYKERLEKAGFDAVVVTDTGADLNVYAKHGLMESAVGCGSPSCSEESAGCCGGSSAKEEAPIGGCCGGSSAKEEASTGGCCVGGSSTSASVEEFLKGINANDYAASVRVHALKAS